MNRNEQDTPDPLKVAWISYFPIEWLDGTPDEVRKVRRQHPATWQQSLLAELEKDRRIKLHILVVRSTFQRNLRFERNGVTFHLLKTRPGWRASTLFWTDTLLIRRTLREVQPDVVHAWGTENGAALVALRLPYPHLVSIQGFLDWFRTLVPLSRHEKLAALLERHSLRRAMLVSAESADTANRVSRAHGNRPVLHIEHPPMQYFSKVRRSVDPSGIRFLSVGTMGYRKGSDLYLSALGQLVGELDFKCVTIGSPSEEFMAPLRGSLPTELWKRFEFKYALSDKEMSREYGAATLMVMPTRADTGPVAVKEAVVAGIPVVASEMGGIPEYVTPGQNGLICQVNNLEDLVFRIREASRHPLFREGRVDPDTLAKKRAHLDPARAADMFLAAYLRAFREQQVPHPRRREQQTPPGKGARSSTST